MVEDLVPILVPIFLCCVLPIAVVAIIFRSVSNSENQRARVMIEAINHSDKVDTDKLIESMKKQPMTPRRLLSLRLLRGLIFFLVGLCFMIYYFVDPLDSLFLLVGLILAAVGIAYLVVYLATRKSVLKEGK